MQRNNKSSQHGGLLIEGLVSLVLISLAALAVVGLQTHAVRVEGYANYRHIAALAASDLTNEMLLNRAIKNENDIGIWSEHLIKLPNAILSIVDVSTEAIGANSEKPASNTWTLDINISWKAPSSKTDDPLDTFSTRVTIPKSST